MLELEKTLKTNVLLDSVNIADELGDRDLEKIGSHIKQGYDLDKASREGWEGNVDKWLELALQVVDQKTTPWPDASNVKYPLLTTAALQFSARAYPALVPNTSVVRGRVIGFDNDGSKLERAIRVGKHMSYQLLEQMEDWEEGMDKLLFALPIVGCMFKKTYFDSVKASNVSEGVYPKELVVNYFTKSLEDAPRVTHELKLSSNEIYERVTEGVFLDVELQTPTVEQTQRQTQTSEQSTGVVPPTSTDSSTPYSLLESHCFLDLDGDGYEEPYIITIEESSNKVLRIVARYDETSITLTVRGDILRIAPINYFTKFGFIPSPDGGFYDIGFGVLLGPINDTINTLVNQMLDSGTMYNMQAGFMAKGIRIKGGNKPFMPGEWKVVASTGDDLRKGLVPLPVKEPSNVLFQLLGTMISSGEKLSSVTEMMTGEIPGQNTKATVAMAAIEQGMKVFSSIYKRNHRSLSKEYKKLFYLNSIYLDEEDMFTILDVGQEKAAQIGRSDYNLDDVDVVPASDPNMSTEQQKLAKVQAIAEILQLGTVNVQEYTKRYLEALEEPNIEALMKMPPPQPKPEVEIEKQKLSMQKAKEEDDSTRAWEQLKINRTLAETKGMLDLAKAEQAELGQQMSMLQAEMQKIRDSIVLKKLDNKPTGGTNGNTGSS
jgi:chaperonin GroES